LPEKVKKTLEHNQMIIIGRIESIYSEKSFIEENRKFISFYQKDTVNKIKLSSVEAILSFKEKNMELVNFIDVVNNISN